MPPPWWESLGLTGSLRKGKNMSFCDTLSKEDLPVIFVSSIQSAIDSFLCAGSKWSWSPVCCSCESWKGLRCRNWRYGCPDVWRNGSLKASYIKWSKVMVVIENMLILMFITSLQFGLNTCSNLLISSMLLNLMFFTANNFIKRSNKHLHL